MNFAKEKKLNYLGEISVQNDKKKDLEKLLKIIVEKVGEPKIMSVREIYEKENKKGKKRLKEKEGKDLKDSYYCCLF